MKFKSNSVKKTGRMFAAAGASLLAATPAQAQGPIEDAGGLLLGLIEGGFGALIMIVAGLVAIIAAAMGAYRASMSCLVVAVGAFILRTVVAIFFPNVVIP